MADLSLKEVETIQRALGIIEGVSWGVTDGVATALATAIEMIDGVLGGADND